jgi:uncharacterized membrane protein YesL
MLHNPTRIRAIEKWAKWLAWLNLIAAIGSIIFLAIFSGKVSYALEVRTGIPTSFWETVPEFTRLILTSLGALADFFILMGASIVVRFLRKYYAQITGME